MIDLESLGNKPDSVILSIGAIKFDPYTLHEPFSPFYMLLDVDEQTALGRTIDDDTLDWWVSQPKEETETVFGDTDRTSLADFTSQFSKYLVGLDKLWAQGPQFDLVAIESMYHQLELPIPWQYWAVRDSRTIMGLGKQTYRPKNEMAHNALADVWTQAKAVQMVFKKLGITEDFYAA